MSEETIPERKRVLPDFPAEISQLGGVLSEDAHRVKVNVELSNGKTHPDLGLTLQDAAGKELSRTTILENFGPLLAFTLHIRQEEVHFPLSLTCQLSYVDDQIHCEKTIAIEKA
jgi:hypothetical protein